jgi:hypothetical protein
MGVDKEVFNIYGMQKASIQHCLTEEFAPVGGFHYIAQASSAIPFIGPIIITALFALTSIYVDKKKNLNRFYNILYYTYIGGFSFVFIKTIFNQTLKYYLTLAIPAFIIYYFILKINKIKLYS